ncbi:flagella synthesis protein FlgN [Thiomicrorhabdus sediminis]|uniref:Flagellar protein FlgN n=1 Tax=Thiomicrorhabdus sediminis TaxID=2580412 RepID=A0A4P9K8A3_9GAMM|nr:flagellar protein FlgN [Thiomicrorhabdus sediminis]QCU90497.1 flagellar protein FlgN [Thiomicrorhabdus sediminis]
MSEADNTRFDKDLFASHIDKLKTFLSAFSDTLSTESQAIRNADTAGIEKIVAEKQSLSVEIEQLSAAIEALLEPLQANIFSFTEHPAFEELSDKDQQLLIETLQWVQQCHDQNLANGMAIQTLSNINRHALDILSGKTEKDVKLYSASGEKTSSKPRKSLGKA